MLQGSIINITTSSTRGSSNSSSSSKSSSSHRHHQYLQKGNRPADKMKASLLTWRILRDQERKPSPNVVGSLWAIFLLTSLRRKWGNWEIREGKWRSEVFIHKDKGFGFICLEIRTLADIARVELDKMPLRGKQLHVCFACHSAGLTLWNLPQYVSSELLEEAFSVFRQVERADHRGWSSKALRKRHCWILREASCSESAGQMHWGLLPANYISSACGCGAHGLLDDEEGLPEKLVITNQQFHKEWEQPPIFAQPGSFEYESAGRHSLRCRTSGRTKWTATSRKLTRNWSWRWSLLTLNTRSR